MDNVHITIRHWLPILTFCPINGFPDLIYISAEFDSFVELYFTRKIFRQAIRFNRKLYMEDVAKRVLDALPHAKTVEVRLAFNRHIVRIERNVSL